MASLSTYDSSNPTKDWGFPELSVNREILPLSKSSVKGESKTADGMAFSSGSSSLPDAAYEKVTWACPIAEIVLFLNLVYKSISIFKYHK